jgi:predicted transcriptional regulator
MNVKSVANEILKISAPKLDKTELEALKHIYTEEYVKVKDVDKNLAKILEKLENLGLVEKRGVVKGQKPDWFALTNKGEKFVESQNPDWFEKLKR